MNRWRTALALALLAVPVACRGPAATPVDGIVLSGQALAGPTCPVVTDPPDPSCEDRPVAGAVIVVLDGDGAEVARLESDADGNFSIRLPPGSYQLVPRPVEGMMGTAQPVEVELVAGADPEPIVISYDTGIR
jgi:hypothetical protein